jgi:predicted ArsR family transcriptional regulator
MDTRERTLRHLKRHGPSSVAELSIALGLSANAVRHHLTRLSRAGVVRLDATANRAGRGRPAQRYTLTVAAEDAFPKRYPELLTAVLREAERRGALDELLEGVAQSLADALRVDLAGLEPRARLLALLRALDFGDMLPALSFPGRAWRLDAHNCVYREAGCQVRGVCDLLPRVIALATGLAAERLECQRDGRSACTFTGSLTSP